MQKLKYLRARSLIMLGYYVNVLCPCYFVVRMQIQSGQGVKLSECIDFTRVFVVFK